MYYLGVFERHYILLASNRLRCDRINVAAATVVRRLRVSAHAQERTQTIMIMIILIIMMIIIIMIINNN